MAADEDERGRGARGCTRCMVVDSQAAGHVGDNVFIACPGSSADWGCGVAWSILRALGPLTGAEEPATAVQICPAPLRAWRSQARSVHLCSLRTTRPTQAFGVFGTATCHARQTAAVSPIVSIVQTTIPAERMPKSVDFSESEIEPVRRTKTAMTKNSSNNQQKLRMRTIAKRPSS